MNNFHSSFGRPLGWMLITCEDVHSSSGHGCPHSSVLGHRVLNIWPAVVQAGSYHGYIFSLLFKGTPHADFHNDCTSLHFCLWWIKIPLSFLTFCFDTQFPDILHFSKDTRLLVPGTYLFQQWVHYFIERNTHQSLEFSCYKRRMWPEEAFSPYY